MKRAQRIRAGLRELPRLARTEPAWFAYATIAFYGAAVAWGLPQGTSVARMFPWGPDELAPLRSIGELARLVGLAEGFGPQYPMMQYYIQAVFTAPYAAWLMLTGGIQGFTGEYPFGLVDPAGSLGVFTVLARTPSALMAGGTVAVAWTTANRLWGREAARFSALTVMFALPMVYYGRTSNVDAPALFWLACGAAVFAAVLEEGITTRRGALLGLFAALSIGTKDAGYAYFAGLAVALIWLRLREAKAEQLTVAETLRPLLAGAGVAVAAYAVTSGLVFSVERFMAHVDFILHGAPMPEGVTSPYYYSGEANLAGYTKLTGQTLRLVSDSVGIPLALAGAVGLVVATRGRRRLLWLALPVLTLFLGTIVPVRFVLIRFTMPITYTAALFAGFALAALVRQGRLGWLAWACIAWSGLRAADLTRQTWFDSRYALSDWLAETLEPGDQVGFYGSVIKLPYLESDISIGVMENQPMTPDAPVQPARDPAVVLIIPQQDSEPVHEWTLSSEDYEALVDGSTGYERAFAAGGTPYLARRFIPFVNPPVQAFVPIER